MNMVGTKKNYKVYVELPNILNKKCTYIHNTKKKGN